MRDDPAVLETIRHDASHVMAEAVQELFPGTQVTIGPAIEDGFYYDFARDEPFSPRRPAEDRSEDARDRRPRREDRARGVGPRRGHRPLRVHRRDLQGGDHPRPARGRDDHASTARASGRTCASGPHLPSTKHRGQGVQADQAGRRLLAGRPPQRPAPAHLRHGLGDAGRPRRLSPAASRRRRSATTASSAGAGPLPHAGRGPGHGVLAPQGLDAVADAGGLYAPPAGRGRLCGGEDAPGARPLLLGEVRPLGEVPAQHVRLRDGGGRGALAQADELPGPRADLQPRPALLPRAADPHGRVRRLPPLRAVGRRCTA